MSTLVAIKIKSKSQLYVPESTALLQMNMVQALWNNARLFELHTETTDHVSNN
jgi:hypothetical protein